MLLFFIFNSGHIEKPGNHLSGFLVTSCAGTQVSAPNETLSSTKVKVAQIAQITIKVYSVECIV